MLHIQCHIFCWIIMDEISACSCNKIQEDNLIWIYFGNFPPLLPSTIFFSSLLLFCARLYSHYIIWYSRFRVLPNMPITLILRRIEAHRKASGELYLEPSAPRSAAVEMKLDLYFFFSVLFTVFQKKDTAQCVCMHLNMWYRNRKKQQGEKKEKKAVCGCFSPIG